jgi:uncharacterized protein YegP (UPF0339 family)
MAGKFEIHRVSNGCYQLRLTDSHGKTIAVSPDYNHLSAVKEGIKALRENAATGVVVDLRQPPKAS